MRFSVAAYAHFASAKYTTQPTFVSEPNRTGSKFEELSP